MRKEESSQVAMRLKWHVDLKLESFFHSRKEKGRKEKKRKELYLVEREGYRDELDCFLCII